MSESGSRDNLADRLEQMANGETEPTGSPEPAASTGSGSAEGSDEAAEATASTEPGAEAEAPVFALDEGEPASRPRPGRAGRPRVRRPTALAVWGTRACLVVGMLLLVPGLWAAAVLAGLGEQVIWGGRSDARAVAWLMLVCWPVAIALIAGALYFARRHAWLEARANAAAAAAAGSGEETAVEPG
jgi:hypothetical protein